jgi:hypothetical protein
MLLAVLAVAVAGCGEEAGSDEEIPVRFEPGISGERRAAADAVLAQYRRGEPGMRGPVYTVYGVRLRKRGRCALVQIEDGEGARVWGAQKRGARWVSASEGGLCGAPRAGADGAAGAGSAGAAKGVCETQQWPIEGNGHTVGRVRYRTNPPTSGHHHPEPAADGIYPPGKSPQVEKTVHTLEHGRIIVQYRPGASPEVVRRLENLVEENDGYHAVLMENQTGMRAAVAATAWGRSITCQRFDDAVLDELRAFREAYTDKAPEFVP